MVIETGKIKLPIAGLPEKRPNLEDPKVFKELKDSIIDGVCEVQNLKGALARENISKEQYIELITLLAEKQERRIDSLEDDKGIDILTGVYNRFALNTKLPKLIEQLNREGERRESSPSSIMVIGLDIDNFKTVNEEYGHPIGDLAIEAVAVRLREVVKEFGGDMVFHPHGDEFRLILVIKKNLTDEQLRDIFIRIQEKTNTDLIVEIKSDEGIVEKKFNMTMAMGYAVLKQSKLEDQGNGEILARELIKAADTDQLKEKEQSTKDARISKYNTL
ncbi:MAG: GGDEF domain-containing protein [Candidatus Paceibacterota bacterium]